MTVGDPKKAMVLGVVALVVVGVAVFRAVPSGGPAPAPSANANSPAAQPQPNASSGGMVVETTALSTPPTAEADPKTLLNDPFSHPGKAAEAGIRKSGETKPEEPPKKVQKPRPNFGGQVPPINPFTRTQVGDGSNPSENTGNSQASDMGIKIVLKAVVSLKDAEALISINDSPALRGRKGARFGDITVVSVGESSATIRFGKETRRIRVGEVVIL